MFCEQDISLLEQRLVYSLLYNYLSYNQRPANSTPLLIRPRRHRKNFSLLNTILLLLLSRQKGSLRSIYRYSYLIASLQIYII